MKKILLIGFFAVIFYKMAYPQLIGTAFNVNYIPEEHNFFPQNMDIVQDNRGVMYFGSSEGITEFDGINWKIIYAINKYPVRSLAIDSKGRIYVGCHGDFGFLEPSKTGKIEYHSICSHIDSSITYMPIITDIKVVNDEIYFCGNNSVFLFKPYSNKDSIFDDSQGNINKINTFRFVRSARFLFNVKNEVYVYDLKKGIYKFSNDKLFLVRNSNAFGERNINSMLEYGNKFIVAFKDKLCIFDTSATDIKNAIIDFHTEADSFFVQNTINKIILIPDFGYSIATKNKGIVIIDFKGKIIDIYNQDNGLNNNTVWNEYYKNNTLWLALNVGITKLEILSPFRYFDKKNNIDGVVLQAAFFKNVFYLTTFSNVVFTEFSDTLKQVIVSQFLPIFNTTTIPWFFNFFKIDNDEQKKVLLIGKQDGIFIIDKDKTQKIDDNTSFCLRQSEINPNILYSGGTESLTILEYSKNTWKSQNIMGFKGFLSSIIETKNGDLWFGTELNGVYFIKKTKRESFDFSSDKNYTVIHFDTLQGLPTLKSIKVYNIFDKIIFTTQSGLYTFDQNTNKFVICNDFGDYFGKQKNIVSSMSVLKNGNIIVNGRIILKKQSDNTYYLDSLTLNRTNSFIHTFDFQLSDSIVLFGTSKGFISFNMNRICKDIQFNTLIRNVSIGEDSTIFYGTNFNINNDSNLTISESQSKSSIPVISYKNNSIIFDYTAPFFENEKENYYSYYLKGYDKKWSSYTQENKKGYTNLDEGEYTFYVKAKNYKNQESTIASYQFTILPPWYRTYWAYISYGILIILLIYGLIVLNSKRLKEKNLALEKIIRSRTIEISEKNEELRQQNEEIVSQSNRLEIINQELEKLSLVARETDNAIIITDNYGNFEWINEGFTRLYGFDIEELIKIYGKSFLSVSSNEDVKKLFEPTSQKKSIIYESATQTKNGDTIYAQTTVTPITDEDGTVLKLVVIDSDIRKLKKAEEEILEKSKLIQYQNEQIKGSIKYAETIQSAILPQKEVLDIFFNNFILYKPKDIVSGDFYWLSSSFSIFEEKKTSFSNQISTIGENITSFEDGQGIIFAVVDCTGHGVPGAFMSLISSILLSEIVNEKRILDPKIILTLLDKNIKKMLRQEQTNNNDGMDISICRFNRISKTEYEIVFSGAIISIVYYKQSQKKLFKLKGNRKNIGGNIFKNNESEFTNEIFNLTSGDIVYLSSDGIIDQCNEERIRWGSTKVYGIISENIDKEMEEQKNILNDELVKFQSKADQRDDITFIGLKLK